MKLNIVGHEAVLIKDCENLTFFTSHRQMFSTSVDLIGLVLMLCLSPVLTVKQGLGLASFRERKSQ